MRTPTDDEIRAEVEDVCQSNFFQRAKRRTDVFRYMANETLLGRKATEREIAAAIWGDSFESFDPSIDSKVRVQKGEIIESLRKFYDGPGKSRRIRLAIEEYSVVASFAEDTRSASPEDRPSTPSPSQQPFPAPRGNPSKSGDGTTIL